jgi:hypothetical protein
MKRKLTLQNLDLELLEANDLLRGGMDYYSL